jgi:amino acid transporter
MDIPPTTDTPSLDADVQLLRSMGYTQELSRSMSGFSNFALSFSIICILAGGITTFQAALGAGGGASIGIGWPVGAVFSLIVAAAMAQISSSYPTSGGLYHWSSILGGKGYGWTTAWFNLLGLIFVVASVNAGVYDPFFKSFVAPLLGVTPETLAKPVIKLGSFQLNLFQSGFVAAITASQAILNHAGIRITTRLTDMSGYLIFAVAIALTASLLVYSKTRPELSRLVTFTNLTGVKDGFWPTKIESPTLAFLSGLLLTVYTITGFDASAHASEETHDAARNVPRGILRSVVWSVLFGYLMVATFVLVLPSVPDGARQGQGFIDELLGTVPRRLGVAIGVGLFATNYLCGLACLTSASRMMFAFARDGGLPASSALRRVHARFQTPVTAIWVSGFLAFAATLYADAFSVLTAGSAVFLYISYVMPVTAGILAEGRTWTTKGPFDLGAWSKPIAALATIGGAILVFVGVQPPNEKVLYLALALGAVMSVFWWVLGERHRFQGPPTTG